MRKRVEQDYIALANECGLVYVGPYPGNVDIKTNWTCKNSHEWCRAIQGGQRCPYCLADKMRKSEQDYHILARERGIKWLGPYTGYVRSKTKWQCEEGHVWTSSYNVVQQNHECPVCIGKARKTEADYHILGCDRNIKWIGSSLPGRVSEKTMWQCSKGHQWTTAYNTIQQGSGCPRCVNMVNGVSASLLQCAVAEMLGVNDEEHVNRKVDGLCVDIILPDDKTIIEYDCWFWHAHKIKEDRRRVQRLLDIGLNVIVIKANRKIPTKEILESAIERAQTERYVEIVLSDWGKGNTRALLGP